MSAVSIPDLARRDLAIAARGITKAMTDSQARAVLKKAYKVPPECDTDYRTRAYKRAWRAEVEVLMVDRERLRQWEKK